MLTVSLTSSICKEVITTNTLVVTRVSLHLTLSSLTSTERDVRKVQFEYRNKALKTSILSACLLCSATCGQLPSDSYTENKEEKIFCSFMFRNF